ncbi:hypothetical protein U9M48_025410 [Paspalum notatum var. saurae]|uniref:Uncharacterized protein n=1 Tax=Paspalum notatum var. saurae TaxID=547442 RepID=A0AAQ3TTJ7_PASNO
MGDLLRGVDDRAASCSRRWRWDSGAAAADGDGGGDRTKRTRICQCKDEDNLRMIRNCVSQYCRLPSPLPSAHTHESARDQISLPTPPATVAAAAPPPRPPPAPAEPTPRSAWAAKALRFVWFFPRRRVSPGSRRQPERLIRVAQARRASSRFAAAGSTRGGRRRIGSTGSPELSPVASPRPPSRLLSASRSSSRLVVNHGSSHLGALRYLIVSRLSKASTIGVYLVPRVVDDVTVKEIEPIVKDFRSSDSVQDAGCPGHQQ